MVKNSLPHGRKLNEDKMITLWQGKN